MAIHLFGLTGGIGSGKSTVARRFRARRVPVMDADVLARDVVQRGTPGLAEIVERFGTDVLDAAGELDRKKLAARVFGDDEARRALNAITHPRVAALSAERVREYEERDEVLACYEVPLFFEARLDSVIRPVVVVAVPSEVAVARAAARDGSTPDEVRARVRAQMPLEEKISRADYVIDNSGSVEATIARADEVLDAVCRSFEIDPTRFRSER